MKNGNSFTGDLGFIGLPDIFQILGGNGSNGILTLVSPYTDLAGRIYFVGGNPVNASLGALHGLDALYDLFGWVEGRFEFREERVRAEPLINHGRMQIVLDALRMLDDGLIKRVGPPSFAENGRTRRQETWTGPHDVQPIIRGPFIDYMHVINEEKILDGERIVNEGCFGNWVWVILEGMVKITRDTVNGPLTLAQLGQGCFIGMLTSFIFTESMRSASVTAVGGDAYLGMLDTQRLSGEYASLSADFRKLLISLSSRLKKVTDTAGDLFLKRPRAEGILEDKEVVMEPGSPRGRSFMITEGECHVTGKSDQGILHLLSLEREDFFGDIPFLDLGLEPQTASVFGTRDLKTRPLDRESLLREYNRLSGTLKNMIENIGTCISVTSRLALGLGTGEEKNRDAPLGKPRPGLVG